MVVLAGKLPNVPIKMLRADLVERAGVRPLQHRPERLNPVRVSLPADVFGDGVTDRFMLPLDAPVGRSVIGVDRGIFLGVFLDEILQRLGIGLGNDLGADLVRVPVLHADDRRLTDRAPARARQFLPLGVAHVLPLAAHVGLVDLHRAVKGLFVAIFAPRLADAMQHEPRRALRDANIPMQLHAGDGLEGRDAQVDRDGPLAQRDVRPRHRRAGADGEVGAAALAPVGHRLGVRDFLRLGAAALRAVATIFPNDRLEPLCGGFLGREHVHQLHDGHPLAMALSRCFTGHFSSPPYTLEYRELPAKCQVKIISPKPYAPV